MAGVCRGIGAIMPMDAA
uniref:Uncharacterized protein n=1 Tax=Arundo donax TaxID=35708 RepID=A0A0A8ZRA6_ARUDO